MYMYGTNIVVDAIQDADDVWIQPIYVYLKVGAYYCVQEDVCYNGVMMENAQGIWQHLPLPFYRHWLTWPTQSQHQISGYMRTHVYTLVGVGVSTCTYA